MEFWFDKVTVLWSEVNAEPCQTSVMELKPLPILGESSIMFDMVPNMPLIKTVARYWETYKTNIMFSELAKNTQSPFILNNLSNCKMNDDPNEKNAFVLEKLNRENCRCRMKAWMFRRDNPLHTKALLIFQQVFSDSIHCLFQSPV